MWVILDLNITVSSNKLLVKSHSKKSEKAHLLIDQGKSHFIVNTLPLIKKKLSKNKSKWIPKKLLLAC